MRIRNLLCTALLAITGIDPATALADLSRTVEFNIAPQALQEALIQYSAQAGVQVTGPADIIDGKASGGVSGHLSARNALARLLAGTKLTYAVINENTVTIRIAAEFGGTESIADGQLETARVADASRASSQALEEGGGMDVGGEPKLEEIVVTAQKRAERLQDVPLPVTTISAAALAERNQLRVQDYYSKVPGLNLTLFGNENAPQISIRGITTGGFTNPTVAIVLDDVSYGATSVPGASPTVPDIDPGDLARIEVLRGPQGTLYGAANIGGLLKFVTIDPSTERLSGRLQAGVSSVQASSDAGYGLRGMVNVPVGETLAVRASGFTLREPGYVDNIQTGVRDANRRESRGGRMSALWRPSETFSLKLSALLQNSERNSPDETDVSLGAGFQLRSFPGTGVYLRDIQAYSATMTFELPGVELTSLSGYSLDETSSRVDQSAIFGWAADAYFPGVTGAVQGLSMKTDKFTQEVRALIPLGKRFEWLLGGFYTEEKVEQRSLFVASDTVTGGAAGSFFGTASPSSFEEFAVFSNVKFAVTERFDLQLGARASRNEQAYGSTITGRLAQDLLGGDPLVVPDLGSEDDAFTYQLTPRFKVSPDLMLYARIASGYRPGGINTACGFPGVPCEYDPDSTVNYEVGVKGSLLGELLAFDASVYHIDWQDIQLSLSTGGFGYQGNASRGKSEGIELSLESKPLKGMTVSTWVAFNDATLTEDFPASGGTSGLSGDRLPHSSRFSGSFSVDHEFPLWPAASGFVGGSVSYVGERRGIFKPAAAVRETLGGYTQADLRTGIRLASWTLSAFVNNVTDKRGVLRTGIDTLQPTYLTYIQPRTIGLSLAKTFGS